MNTETAAAPTHGETRALRDIHPASYNPRRIGDAELEKLITSLRVFGFVEPVVIRPEDGLNIGGHQRVVAYRELLRRNGLDSDEIEDTHVPVVLLPPGTSDSDAKRLNLALNKIQGEWDYTKLNVMLQDLRVEVTAIADFEVTGFTLPEVDDLHAAMNVEGRTPPHGGRGGPKETADLAGPAPDAATVAGAVEAAMAEQATRWVIEFTTAEDAATATACLECFGYTPLDPSTLPDALLAALAAIDPAAAPPPTPKAKRKRSK